MLQLKNLTVKIGDKTILKNINVDFKPGEIYAVMGPNGSGKSTLAQTVMGHTVYEVNSKSKILFNNEDIKEDTPDERSKKGIFLSFQSPMSLSGVSIYQLLRYALNGKMDPLTIRQNVQKYAKILKISDDLLSRSLNDGFSGGEKKKMEVLQAALLQPKLMFFDEVDTGVDVDALKAIAKFIVTLKKNDVTIVVITHYNRILKYLKPDEVLILKSGELIKKGDASLADEIEREGYDNLK